MAPSNILLFSGILYMGKHNFLSKFKNITNLFLKRPFFLWRGLLKKNTGHGHLDKKLIFSLNKSRIPNLKQLKYVGQFLSRKEKRAISGSLIIVMVSLLFLGIDFSRKHIKTAPQKGGSYVEGLVGSPNLINPLYSSINNVDADICHLIYSGLLKRDKKNDLSPDLAEKFEISANEKEYTFYLRKDAEWHNKLEVTSDDVVFTFNAIVDPEYKSPLRLNFEGMRVEKIDEYKVKFILSEPYAAFLELLTIGILPRKILSQVSPSAVNLAEFNLKPVGSGPYKFKSLSKDKSGNIKSYELEANNKYYEKTPYLQNISFKFFNSFEEAISALNEGRIEGIDFIPKEKEEKIMSKNKYAFHYLNQPQLTALFFNQNRLKPLEDKRVRQALAYAINKDYIVSTTSPEYLQKINSPILPMFPKYYKEDVKKYEYNLEEAEKLLEQAGWKITEVEKNEKESDDKETESPPIEPGIWRKKGNDYLTLSLTTVDQPDNIAIASLIKNFWEKLNIKVDLSLIPPDFIQTEAIKPRNYQILLYGEILGADPDQYPFWHSSQIGFGGLNLANYSNKKADELLEDARITNNAETRAEKYKSFQEIIAEDLPAIFLYSKKYTYVQDKKIKGFDTSDITIPSDRFKNISNWYIKTGRKIVW